MRLLFTIPHYFRSKGSDEPSQARLRGTHASVTGSPAGRVRALRTTVMSLHQTFGPSQAMIHHADRRAIPANESTRHDVQVVVATNGNAHLMNEAALPSELCDHVSVDGDPTRLGFACHQLLRDRFGGYDFYCFLEDDLSLRDPWFFDKLRWFHSHVGDDNVLMPNRFERSEEHRYKKCYLDGDLALRVTEPFQDTNESPELKYTVLGRPLRMIRPLNPHSGCFFLNTAQMKHWAEQPYFENQEAGFVGPLESAATLGIMKTFRIYKPARENASFLEIEHYGSRFIDLIGKRV